MAGRSCQALQDAETARQHSSKVKAQVQAEAVWFEVRGVRNED